MTQANTPETQESIQDSPDNSMPEYPEDDKTRLWEYPVIA